MGRSTPTRRSSWATASRFSPADEVGVPDDADVIDAPHGYLIPGLWDMHVHSPIVPLQAANARLLNDVGVVLLAATDVGIPTLVPGISLHQELVLLVEAGLTPLEALRTATLNPTRVLGLADSLGTIDPGKFADLVLLDADPLADIANTQRIRAVVADGRLYLRADLDRFSCG